MEFDYTWTQIWIIFSIEFLICLYHNFRMHIAFNAIEKGRQILMLANLQYANINFDFEPIKKGFIERYDMINDKLQKYLSNSRTAKIILLCMLLANLVNANTLMISLIIIIASGFIAILFFQLSKIKDFMYELSIFIERYNSNFLTAQENNLIEKDLSLNPKKHSVNFDLANKKEDTNLKI